MKTIKIIDLLNKIANGEDVLKEIKLYNNTFYFDDFNNFYYSETNEDFFEIYNGSILNDIVEIIEEDKPIEKLELEEANNKVALKTDSGDYNVRLIDVNLILKINELIDKLNELNKKVE